MERVGYLRYVMGEWCYKIWRYARMTVNEGKEWDIQKDARLNVHVSCDLVVVADAAYVAHFLVRVLLVVFSVRGSIGGLFGRKPRYIV